MFLIVVLLILMSVYVAQNKKIKDETKTGWFIFVIIISVLILLFSLL